MKFTKTQAVSLRVVILFIMAINSTFIGEFLSDFLGDWRCNGCSYGSLDNIIHSSRIHFGYRHWLYFIMCIILFVIQAIDIFNFIESK